MIRGILNRLMVMGALVAPVPVVAGEVVPTITDVRHGVHAERLRLIFDVTPEPAFALFTLRDPDRIVLDFPSLAWRPKTDSLSDLPYISAMRYGLFRHDRARLVLDLNTPVEIERAFTHAPRGGEPGRLVLDLHPVTRAAFDARAGWPENARWSSERTARRPENAAPDDIVVALDPGHGGIDPGASGGSLREKTVVLRMARRIAALLDRTPGFTAVLTRDADVFVPLAERVALAHDAGANIMISLHADVTEEGQASGMSAYTLSEEGNDAAAAALAARENRSDVLAGADLGGEADDLTRLLVELAQRGTQVESAKLGEAMIEGLTGRVELLRTRPLRQAGFRVLKAPDIPSVLIELGFLNSARDRQRLSDELWQERAAKAIVAGLIAYKAAASPGFLTPR